jgi:hypothetical protein
MRLIVGMIALCSAFICTSPQMAVCVEEQFDKQVGKILLHSLQELALRERALQELRSRLEEISGEMQELYSSYFRHPSAICDYSVLGILPITELLVGLNAETDTPALRYAVQNAEYMHLLYSEYTYFINQHLLSWDQMAAEKGSLTYKASRLILMAALTWPQDTLAAALPHVKKLVVFFEGLSDGGVQAVARHLHTLEKCLYLCQLIEKATKKPIRAAACEEEHIALFFSSIPIDVLDKLSQVFLRFQCFPRAPPQAPPTPGFWKRIFSWF